MIEAPADREVTFRVRSRSDLAAAIVDAGGHSLAEADENEFGTESITVSLDGVPPFFLLVEQWSEHTAHVTVEGDAPLTALQDPDDGIILDLPGRGTLTTRLGVWQRADGVRWVIGTCATAWCGYVCSTQASVFERPETTLDHYF